MITFKLNGKDVQGEEGEYILQVAERYGVEIPTLCFHKALGPAGMCRLCTVEVFDGRKTSFVTACNYPIKEGMAVNTETDAVHEGRKLIVELLLARCPNVPAVKELAASYGIKEPRFKQRDDDCILCGLCVRICERMGNSAITLTGRGVDMKVDTPFHLQTELCMACGACASVCPTGHIKLEDITKHTIQPIPSEYDMGLAGRKPVYIPYPQAVPKAPAIDRDYCMHFKTGGCKICTTFCSADAIDHSQEDETVELNVGSIILAPGFEPYDPAGDDTYQHSHFPNVVTSMEFERILSASGPYEAHLVRPSDEKEPKKIAWIQCVGSRNVNQCNQGYCSAVCCMYAIKEAVIAKEHSSLPLDTAIFFMDMRTYGKDFEKYYNRAKDEIGVRFVRSRIHTIEPVGTTGDLKLVYATETGNRKEEVFDMVVLSIGLMPPAEAKSLAQRLDIGLDKHLFAVTRCLAPIETTRPGVYVCGAFQGPKDIPGTVMEASAAADAAMGLLAPARNSLVKKKEYPIEKNILGQEPRIGVFVCH